MTKEVSIFLSYGLTSLTVACGTDSRKIIRRHKRLKLLSSLLHSILSLHAILSGRFQNPLVYFSCTGFQPPLSWSFIIRLISVCDEISALRTSS